MAARQSCISTVEQKGNDGIREYGGRVEHCFGCERSPSLLIQTLHSRRRLAGVMISKFQNPDLFRQNMKEKMMWISPSPWIPRTIMDVNNETAKKYHTR
jgi:hypothetical protein